MTCFDRGGRVLSRRMTKELHILSLGAGVQSTAIYLMAMEGKIRLDHAVFADTQDEPVAVYKHLAWLVSLGGPPIHITSRGKMSVDMMRGENTSGGRFAAVPFFIKMPDGTVGMGRRQCSKEYKVEPVERYIRRSIVGLQPRQRIPKDVEVHQYFGISVDEARRAVRIRERVKHSHFPLLDMDQTRRDCEIYLGARVPHEVPKSACVFCPFRDDAGWMALRKSPEDWAVAVRVDAALREPGRIVKRGLKGELYVHRSCVPLDKVEFRHEKQFNMFTLECEGMCGN